MKFVDRSLPAYRAQSRKWLGTYCSVLLLASLVGVNVHAADVARATQTGSQGKEAQGAQIAPDLAAQRARLEDMRQTENQRFDALESACYQRFAVNNCLKDVQRQRTSSLNSIKREEMQVGAQERTRNAADARAAIAEKAREYADKVREARANAGGKDLSSRQKEQLEKQADHAARLPDGKQNLPAKAGQEPAGPDAATQAKNRTAFEKKQQDAAQRRADLEKRLAQKSGASQTLPVPTD